MSFIVGYVAGFVTAFIVLAVFLWWFDASLGREIKARDEYGGLKRFPVGKKGRCKCGAPFVTVRGAWGQPVVYCEACDLL